MTVTALILGVALVAVIVSSGGLVRSLVRSHTRERALLVNQILHLSGRTWTPPPAEEWKPSTDGEPLVHVYTMTPEQEPYQ